MVSVWPKIAERIRSADRVLLLTDFDGTLSPIAGRPEEAVLPEGTKQAVHALVARWQVGVAVVSGRALSDIRNKVGIPGITYAGNHGLEIDGPSLHFVYAPAEILRPVIRHLYAALNEALSGFPGAFVEDKGIALSVHYRQVAEERAAGLKRACEDVIRGPRSEGKVTVVEGKQVYEVRPGVVWDKENAVNLLMACWAPSTGGAANLVLFLGDGPTDEPGFEAVGRRGGVTVFVGEPGGSTAADYFLRTPAEVEEFLRRLHRDLG